MSAFLSLQPYVIDEGGLEDEVVYMSGTGLGPGDIAGNKSDQDLKSHGERQIKMSNKIN